MKGSAIQPLLMPEKILRLRDTLQEPLESLRHRPQPSQQEPRTYMDYLGKTCRQAPLQSGTLTYRCPWAGLHSAPKEGNGRAPVGVGLGLGVSPPGLASPAGSLYPKKGGFFQEHFWFLESTRVFGQYYIHSKHYLVLSVRSVMAALGQACVLFCLCL